MNNNINFLMTYIESMGSFNLLHFEICIIGSASQSTLERHKKNFKFRHWTITSKIKQKLEIIEVCGNSQSPKQNLTIDTGNANWSEMCIGVSMTKFCFHNHDLQRPL